MPRQPNKKSMLAASLLATHCIAFGASADGAGTFLVVTDGVLTTAVQNGDASVTAPVMLFGATFGDSGFPGLTSNPGLHAASGTFTPGTKIGCDVPESLQAWNGAGFVPCDETLTISFLTLSVTTGSGFVAGFELGVQANGGFHRHLNYVLNGPSGGAALDGIYLLVRDLQVDGGDLGSLLSTWGLCP